MLLTKGLTLMQKDRMLVLLDLTKDLPQNLIPNVPPEEHCPAWRTSEIVNVCFPLGRRPAETVVKEIEPLLGK